ncbi:hypothetical protein AAFF_G00292320 [Aldrovandia affinis]|uniref:Uncharacterized protein n=1 Tax=Aldrovandia affinis TaxID=143900 RepID=A0AAD7SSG3_9TELE|nr:hypothetical protein AAFF_G00292320 [Aldrovandia affinis]
MSVICDRFVVVPVTNEGETLHNIQENEDDKVGKVGNNCVDEHDQIDVLECKDNEPKPHAQETSPKNNDSGAERVVPKILLNDMPFTNDFPSVTTGGMSAWDYTVKASGHR